MELTGVDRDDLAINELIDSLRDEGLTVDQSQGEPTYAIDLPDDWEDYVKMRSKSGRREIRQSRRVR